MTSRAYFLLTLIFYAFGALQVLAQALMGRRLRTSLTVIAILLGFAFHTAGLSQRWTEAGHFPAVGLHDAASFVAWTNVLVFLLAYVRTRVDALSLLVYAGGFSLMLVAAPTPASERGDPSLKSMFRPIHTNRSLLG